MRVRLRSSAVGSAVLEPVSEGRDAVEVRGRVLGLKKSRAQRRSIGVEESFRVFL